jgi:hypothetical protein
VTSRRTARKTRCGSRGSPLDTGKGAAAPVANLEAGVLEPAEQTLYGAERRRLSQYPGETPSHREVLVGGDEGVDQLAGKYIDDPPQGFQRARRRLVPGKQRDRVRDQRGVERSLEQRLPYLRWIAGSERGDAPEDGIAGRRG